MDHLDQQLSPTLTISSRTQTPGESHLHHSEHGLCKTSLSIVTSRLPLLRVASILSDQLLVSSVSLELGSQFLLGFDSGIGSKIRYELNIPFQDIGFVTVMVLISKGATLLKSASVDDIMAGLNRIIEMDEAERFSMGNQNANAV